MRNVLFGFIAGLVLAGSVGSAQTPQQPMLPPPMPFYGLGYPYAPIVPVYPPAYQSLPPMPEPHWQSPC